MKSFKDLSLNISEEEYRNNGRFHYSDISGYMKEGFSYFMKPHAEESESLLFGSMVDCIVTEGIDRFNEKYCVAREFNLSDNQKDALKVLSTFRWERIEDIPSQCILETLGMYYKNPKSQVAKLIEEGNEYYRFLYENQSKTAVEFKMFQDAVDVANKLLTSETTRQLLSDNIYNVDRFFQLKFNGDYEGIPITAMVDMLYIDHQTMTVYPFDLKTTCANYEWEFPRSFLKYYYHLQARLYSYILRQVMDADDFYKDYKLAGFTFIYISRQNKTPLIWTFEENLHRGDIEIETKSGGKIVLKDFVKPLKEMSLIKSEERNIPLGISSSEGNDVITHLKDF